MQLLSTVSTLGGDVGLPRQVKIVEVGPRDGLQNEKVDQVQIVYGRENSSLH